MHTGPHTEVRRVRLLQPKLHHRVLGSIAHSDPRSIHLRPTRTKRLRISRTPPVLKQSFTPVRAWDELPFRRVSRRCHTFIPPGASYARSLGRPGLVFTNLTSADGESRDGSQYLFGPAIERKQIPRASRRYPHKALPLSHSL